MCGIAGIWSKTGVGLNESEKLKDMVQAIARRGPDFQNISKSKNAVLGHARLSILDISDNANQPMHDASGRYTLIFNGEIYNFKELKKELLDQQNIVFKTSGDTEVLLHGLIHHGIEFVKKLNGFFAFAFYDCESDKMLLVRDRYGIKPMYYQYLDNKLIFGSSLNAVAKGIEHKTLDKQSLAAYLQYSYIPAPASILSNVFKMMPGHFMEVSAKGIDKGQYYQLPDTEAVQDQNQIESFKNILTQSVQDRLVSDVPLGTFLSGGYDSSIITKLACESLPNIPAFSIGFPDNPFFDESQKAKKIAKHLGVDHHIIEVGEKKIDEALHCVLDAIDEPFADSSAVLVNILSDYTRNEVTVALSGDGADEILGGYNKHRALLRSSQSSTINALLKTSAPILDHVPESRSSSVLNQMRKVKRYAGGLGLSYNDRYDAWASFTPKEAVDKMLIENQSRGIRNHALDTADFNTVLKADMRLVLPNDMLHKVDLMSMYHGLEVRVPFLDHRLVDFLFKLPAEQKLNEKNGKTLLKNAFADSFPEGMFDGHKKGFEAPLSHWLKGPLQPLREKYLNAEYLAKQGLFHPDVISKLEAKSISAYPGDTPHTIWALIVFQDWYAKHF